MTKLERPGPLVEVEWVDSAGHSAWHSPDEARELVQKTPCLSVGYLTEDKPEGIVITQGTGAIGQWLGSMGIPRVAVIRVRKLR